MKQKREPEDDASRPLAQSSEEKSLFSFKRRRQKEINERRRLLRNAGVYGNSNRVRNERTREIAILIGEAAARPEVRKRRRRDEVERDNVRLRLAAERQVANSLQSPMQKQASQSTDKRVYISCGHVLSKANAVSVLDFCRDTEVERSLRPSRRILQRC
ncbi:hypothetical protein PC119_g4787 [Phytophthora cactorum]|uniref:Uncharacterized protein n=1 Tax=Phytophthora cactorum TaxID=29920 RepID=A0A8T1D749_9STRA|nr:hypothetical protein PC113_g6271 [Phytophthora cactorum]KAG2937144.1 hypothetical protein PC115_g4396 [Phytophthora cactorum]KAG3034787.1 hypothetical protein PC119_g4787 [Phytophthora cactorum]KAG3187131.1 hypothetical protein C6341_g3474 [Phytophthora cactorum]